MTDRELLKQAAKAANLKWVDDREHGLTVQDDGPYNYAWNPLTDDGDALRLAVKLEINICFGANYVIANDVQNPTVNNAHDPYAATRRAIVRAAAEIGNGIAKPKTSCDLLEDNYYKTQAEAEEFGRYKIKKDMK